MRKILALVSALVLSGCNGAYSEQDMSEARAACSAKFGVMHFEHDINLRPIHARCKYKGYIWTYSRSSELFYNPQLDKGVK